VLLLLKQTAAEVAFLLLPFLVVICVCSLLVNFWQVGPLFTLKTLSAEHNLKRVGSALKSRFSSQTWRDLALLAVKFAFLLAAGAWLLRTSLPDILRLGRGDFLFSAQSAGTLVSGVLLKLALLVGLFGIADLLLRRSDFRKQSRLTWEEKRREFEEEEGKPEVRMRVYHAARELLDEGGSVETADAVLRNPTHLVVALARTRRVRGGQSQIGYRVVAKGSGLAAQRLLQQSRRLGIPEYRSVPLTRRLYIVKLGGEVPPELFQTVHLILEYLYGRVLRPLPPQDI
jgi:type III secretion protein U